jgi:hypothetical protein
MCAILLLLAANIDLSTTLNDRVDLIELNHFYDDQGRLVFDQWLFYDWDNHHRQFIIVDWRLCKTNDIVMRNHHRRNYSLSFPDHKHRNALRKVTAGGYCETWTQYDPELVNREIVPIDRRRELRKPQPKKKAK